MFPDKNTDIYQQETLKNTWVSFRLTGIFAYMLYNGSILMSLLLNSFLISDIYFTLRNPFSNSQSRFGVYRFCCCTMLIIMVIVTFIGADTDDFNNQSRVIASQVLTVCFFVPTLVSFVLISIRIST